MALPVAHSSAAGANPSKKCVITITTGTFMYSFKTITTPIGAVHPLEHQTMSNDYSQLVQLQCLMTQQRKHLEGHTTVAREAGEDARGGALVSEMANLDRRLHGWLWELESIEQSICRHP